MFTAAAPDDTANKHSTSGRGPANHDRPGGSQKSDDAKSRLVQRVQAVPGSRQTASASQTGSNVQAIPQAGPLRPNELGQQQSRQLLAGSHQAQSRARRAGSRTDSQTGGRQAGSQSRGGAPGNKSSRGGTSVLGPKLASEGLSTELLIVDNGLLSSSREGSGEVLRQRSRGGGESKKSNRFLPNYLVIFCCLSGLGSE